MPSYRLVVALLAAAPMFAAPWKEGYIRTSDDVRLHYLTGGSGPSIVFQPGGAMPAEIWEPQIKTLSNSFRVAAVNPCSQGKSGLTADGLYPKRRARDIKGIIDRRSLAPAGPRGILLVDGVIGREPTLATVATYKSWTEKVQAETLRERMPSARIEMFENAGQALFVNEAERFNALLADFAARAK